MPTRLATLDDVPELVRVINRAYEVEAGMSSTSEQTTPTCVSGSLGLTRAFSSELPPFYSALGFTTLGSTPYPYPSRTLKPVQLVHMTKPIPHTSTGQSQTGSVESSRG